MPIPAGAGLHGYDYKEVSREAQTDTGSDTLVQQAPAVEMDINNIVRRFGITASMPFGAASGMYGDFTDIVDYESMVDRMARVDRAFESLPAEVRERFGNDPGKLVSFAQSASYEEFLERTSPTPAPDAVEPTPEA